MVLPHRDWFFFSLKPSLLDPVASFCLGLLEKPWLTPFVFWGFSNLENVLVPLGTTHHPGIFFLSHQYLRTTVLYLANGYGTSSRKEQAHESEKSVYTIKEEVKGGLLRSFFSQHYCFQNKVYVLGGKVQEYTLCQDNSASMKCITQFRVHHIWFNPSSSKFIASRV